MLLFSPSWIETKSCYLNSTEPQQWWYLKQLTANFAYITPNYSPNLQYWISGFILSLTYAITQCYLDFSRNFLPWSLPFSMFLEILAGSFCYVQAVWGLLGWQVAWVIVLKSVCDLILTDCLWFHKKFRTIFPPNSGFLMKNMFHMSYFFYSNVKLTGYANFTPAILYLYFFMGWSLLINALWPFKIYCAPRIWVLGCEYAK